MAATTADNPPRHFSTIMPRAPKKAVRPAESESASTGTAASGGGTAAGTVSGGATAAGVKAATRRKKAAGSPASTDAAGNPTGEGAGAGAGAKTSSGSSSVKPAKAVKPSVATIAASLDALKAEVETRLARLDAAVEGVAQLVRQLLIAPSSVANAYSATASRPGVAGGSTNRSGVSGHVSAAAGPASSDWLADFQRSLPPTAPTGRSAPSVPAAPFAPTAGASPALLGATDLPHQAARHDADHDEPTPAEHRASIVTIDPSTVITVGTGTQITLDAQQEKLRKWLKRIMQQKGRRLSDSELWAEVATGYPDEVGGMGRFQADLHVLRELKLLD